MVYAPLEHLVYIPSNGMSTIFISEHVSHSSHQGDTGRGVGTSGHDTRQTGARATRRQTGSSGN